MEKVIIIGAGPCGLAAAVECKRRGMDPLVIDKGCLVNTIYNFPTHMLFFSTPELIEIGDIPFSTVNEKPTRHEALTYYRLVAKHYHLRIHTFEEVNEVKKSGDFFKLNTTNRFGETNRYRSQYVILATGYYDQPNYLNIKGENLPKVSHYFKDAHPYIGMKVAVIGARNSGVDAAMELERVGAEVKVIYRADRISETVKSWVKPIFESTVSKGRIEVLWNSHVKEIKPKTIVVETEGRIKEIENDFVFALTGYRPDQSFLTKMGVGFNEQTGAPLFNEDTMETEVEGLYIAGVVSAGYDANAIFIENGRFHGHAIADHMMARAAGDN